MSGYCTVFGIDSHARVTTVCAVDASTGEVRKTVGKSPNGFGELVRGSPGGRGRRIRVRRRPLVA